MARLGLGAPLERLGSRGSAQKLETSWSLRPEELRLAAVRDSEERKEGVVGKKTREERKELWRSGEDGAPGLDIEGGAAGWWAISALLLAGKGTHPLGLVLLGGKPRGRGLLLLPSC
ncbi:hypothetical protein MLD38_037215 [Melastoma candidum]|uniref:Uncharacterized protein n=1 Tax=Melastoma candidum TaxID=119954 RepID=A0ACB9LM19_9MYRT|nr:hypothetical protein MLD38_037215 [Melastoma candidum]